MIRDSALFAGSDEHAESAGDTKFELFTRLAFGFHSHAPLVALAMLELGGLCPPLPGRS